MRKVILFVQVSLDGFFEGLKKEIDWHMVDDELFAHVIEVLKAMGAFLNGRVTYELMAGFWPTADADPGSAPSREGPNVNRELPASAARTEVREAEEVEGRRLRRVRPSRQRRAPKRHEPRLLGMQRQPKLREPLRKDSQDPFRILAILKTEFRRPLPRKRGFTSCSSKTSPRPSRRSSVSLDRAVSPTGGDGEVSHVHP